MPTDTLQTASPAPAGAPAPRDVAHPGSLEQRLAAIEAKLDATYRSAEKTRKYILWTVIVSAVVFVLPLIGLVFALPSFLNYYGDIGSLSNPGSSPSTLNSLGF